EDQQPGVGNEVAGVEPSRRGHAFVVEAFPRRRPFGADAHEDVPREPDGEKRPVAEPQHSCIAPRKGERAGAGERGADKDHRAEDVQEEQKVPAVRPNGGECAHAPGFQIMSTRIRSTTIVARACNTMPFCVRLSASSSAFAPVWPADRSSWALFIPSM